MILRGAGISQRTVRVAADVRRVEVRSEVADVAALPAAPPVAELRPVLDTATVRAWLAKQGDATRRELAVELAPEIAAECEEGRRRGRQEGREEAAAEVNGEREVHAAALARVAAELRDLAERQTTALAANCAEIVLEVLKKIAGPLLAQREGVEGAVLQVLRRVKNASDVVVRVRPAELEVLQAAHASLAAALGDANLALVPDQRVQLGGCIVESKLGNLDGRLEVQLGELCETLRLAKIDGVKQ